MRSKVRAKKKSSGFQKFFGVMLLLFLVPLFLGVVANMSSEVRSGAASTTKPASQKPALYATKQANIRGGPSTNYDVVTTASVGARLPFLEKSGSWYRLTSPDTTQQRWVHESIVQTEAQRRAQNSARARAAKAESSIQLKYGSWSWRNEHGYAIAEGQVTNTTGKSLENVMAVVTFKTDDGGFVTTGDAMIDYNPILPGQTSSWKVMATWNPAMGGAYLEFKTLFGGTLKSKKQ